MKLQENQIFYHEIARYCRIKLFFYFLKGHVKATISLKNQTLFEILRFYFEISNEKLENSNFLLHRTQLTA